MIRWIRILSLSKRHDHIGRFARGPFYTDVDNAEETNPDKICKRIFLKINRWQQSIHKFS